MPIFESYLLTHQLISESLLSQIKVTLNHHSLLNYLARNKLVSSEALANAASKALNIDLQDLSLLTIDTKVVTLLPSKMIFECSILPIHQHEGYLDLAMSDPSDSESIQTVQFITGMNVNGLLVTFSQLQEFIQHYVIKTSTTKPDQNSLLSTPAISSQEDKAVIDWSNDILAQAIQTKTSDIHIEMFATYCRVRFRQSGLLNETAQLTKEQAQPILTRLKLLGNLNIAEKRLPQDGHFKMDANDGKSIDIRISSCPTIYGEKLVLRLLNSEKIFRSINQINLLEVQRSLLLTAIERPHGLILVTGPTGSGKTVTLYAILHHLNTIEKNISSVEDPVEIDLAGVNQVNINVKSGLTFPAVLRAFLRQDPDVVMIGEIRDFETAEMAIRSAQTGRLVLSTLHTNSALGALSRLQNMGIAPYNIASAITFVSAQRLIRKLCPYCKQSYFPSSSLRSLLNFQTDTKLYKAQGCSQCQGGYVERIAIHETFPMNENFITQWFLHSKNNDASEPVSTHATLTLKDSALEALQQGITSFEEIARVIPAGDFHELS